MHPHAIDLFDNYSSCNHDLSADSSQHVFLFVLFFKEHFIKERGLNKTAFHI